MQRRIDQLEVRDLLETSDSQTSGRGGQAHAPGRRSTGPTRPRFSYVAMEWQGGTEYCLRRRTTTNEATADEAVAEERLRNYGLLNGLTEVPCPARLSPSAGSATEAVVQEFWRTVTLPPAPLSTMPTFALTGKKLYLQIGGSREVPFAVDNPLGDDVVIQATSDYEVDWGDGSTTVTRSQGGPWPDGDLTHTYIHASPSVTITVVQRWTAAWSAGGAEGVLDELETRSSLDIAVRSLEAVRNR